MSCSGCCSSSCRGCFCCCCQSTDIAVVVVMVVVVVVVVVVMVIVVVVLVIVVVVLLMVVVVIVDSAPSLRSLLFFVVDSVCLSVCMYVCHGAPSNRFFFLLFLDGINPFFWRSSLHIALYKTLFFYFQFRPPNVQNLLPKICMSILSQSWSISMGH